MELEVDFIKLPNNQTLNPCNMPLETERIENVISDLYGSQE